MVESSQVAKIIDIEQNYDLQSVQAHLQQAEINMLQAYKFKVQCMEQMTKISKTFFRKEIFIKTVSANGMKYYTVAMRVRPDIKGWNKTIYPKQEIVTFYQLADAQKYAESFARQNNCHYAKKDNRKEIN